jgi:DNA helicase-4
LQTINKPIEDFSVHAQFKDKAAAKMVYNTVKFLDEHLKIQGLRTYTDQLIDTLNFFKKYPSMIPRYEHVLIDEYQDVNAMQVQLLKILTEKNIFAVGDPRQSIYGWRGSDINFIMHFDLDWGEFESIHLTKNYRSAKQIVDFMNLAITDMNLPDLLHHHEFESKLNTKEYLSEQSERNAIVENVLSSSSPLHEIFVLARTNKELIELSTILKEKNVPHIIRTDDVRTNIEQKDGHLMLATIHAIKGLEADEVYIMGAGSKNFPSRAVDHPAIEMVKENYDKEAEELRLFYVAISRAKKKLMVTYTEKPTKFLTEEMKKFLK